jgi:hypothetical protein
MDSFWVKMTIFAVIVVGLVILVKRFAPSGDLLEMETKSFREVVEEDDRRLRAEPKFKEPPETGPVTEAREDKGVEGSLEAVKTEPPSVEPAELQFRELSEIERIEAERLFNVALQHRKIGRLPGPGYKLMVDCCREIIAKFPGSVYAFKAKRMLGDIPERYRARYDITEEEIDLGNLE